MRPPILAWLCVLLGGADAAACTHARVAVERVAAVQHRLCFAPSSHASCRLGDVANLTLALGSVCGIFELDAPRSTDDVRAAYKSERALMGYLDLDARAAPLDLTCASDDKLVVRTSKHGCDYEVNYFTATDYMTVFDADGRDARVALHATLPPSPPPSPPPPPPPSPHPPYPSSPPPPLAPQSAGGALVALAVTLSLVGACGCVFACAFAAWRRNKGEDSAAPRPTSSPPTSSPPASSLVDRVVPRRARVDVPASASPSTKPSRWKLVAQKLRAPSSAAAAAYPSAPRRQGAPRSSSGAPSCANVGGEEAAHSPSLGSGSRHAPSSPFGRRPVRAEGAGAKPIAGDDAGTGCAVGILSRFFFALRVEQQTTRKRKYGPRPRLGRRRDARAARSLPQHARRRARPRADHAPFLRAARHRRRGEGARRERGLRPRRL